MRPRFPSAPPPRPPRLSRAPLVKVGKALIQQNRPGLRCTSPPGSIPRGCCFSTVPPLFFFFFFSLSSKQSKEPNRSWHRPFSLQAHLIVRKAFRAQVSDINAASLILLLGILNLLISPFPNLPYIFLSGLRTFLALGYFPQMYRTGINIFPPCQCYYITVQTSYPLLMRVLKESVNQKQGRL